MDFPLLISNRIICDVCSCKCFISAVKNNLPQLLGSIVFNHCISVSSKDIKFSCSIPCPAVLSVKKGTLTKTYNIYGELFLTGFLKWHL